MYLTLCRVSKKPWQKSFCRKHFLFIITSCLHYVNINNNYLINVNKKLLVKLASQLKKISKYTTTYRVKLMYAKAIP